MQKKLLILYIPFIVYTVLSFFNDYPKEIDLWSLFTFEGDLLLVMVFNMLGVFPLLYFSYVLSFKKQPFYVYVLFGLGFMLGGFVILLGLMLLKPERKPIKKIHQLSFIILPMLLIIMLLSGILLGNMDVYFDLFLNNQFVHIMTIDLFVLILTPYVLGYVHWPLLNYTKWFLP